MWLTGRSFSGEDVQDALAGLSGQQKVLYLGGGTYAIAEPIDLGDARVVGLVEGAKCNLHPLWIGPYLGSTG